MLPTDISSVQQMKETSSSFSYSSVVGWRLVGLTVLSLLVFLALVGWQLHAALTSDLGIHSEESNRQFTRMFANNNWSQLRPLLRLTASPEDAKTNSNLDEISAIVRQFTAGTDIVAVKIFNAQGLMLYATDPSQIGSDRSRSEGFLSALRGKVATELIHRDSISGFDGEMHDRDLVASYVPIRNDGVVEAVVEVYSDRTLALFAANSIVFKLVGFLALVLFILLLPWLLLVRRHQTRWHSLQVECQTLSATSQHREREIAAAIAARKKFLECVSKLLEQPVSQALALAESLRPVPKKDSVSPLVAPIDYDELKVLLQTSHRRVHEFRRLVLVDSGTLEVTRAPFVLEEAIHRSVQQLDTEMATAGCKLMLYVAPGAGGICHGDATLIQDVVIYLLRLACQRMRSPGNIQLRVQPEAEGIVIDVIDCGEPMDSDLLPILTDSYVGESAMTKAAASDCETDHKIALLLISGLTRCMGGRLQAQTESGRGTSVHLWLPLTPQFPLERS